MCTRFQSESNRMRKKCPLFILLMSNYRGLWGEQAGQLVLAITQSPHLHALQNKGICVAKAGLTTWDTACLLSDPLWLPGQAWGPGSCPQCWSSRAGSSLQANQASLSLGPTTYGHCPGGQQLIATWVLFPFESERKWLLLPSCYPPSSSSLISIHLYSVLSSGFSQKAESIAVFQHRWLLTPWKPWNKKLTRWPGRKRKRTNTGQTNIKTSTGHPATFIIIF